MSQERSYGTITAQDLRRLARIVRMEREDFFLRHPEWAILYRKRVVCSALCGDAASHYLNGVTGFEEFVALSFYAQQSDAPFPVHQVSRHDFGKSRFGRHPGLPDTYRGRRVVLQGRAIDARPDDDPLAALQRYLAAAGTPTAKDLASASLVMLEPEPFLGMQAWPALMLGRRN